MIPWLPGLDNLPQEDLHALETAAISANLDPIDLALHISQESTFVASARNGSQSGLIQMSPATSRVFNGSSNAGGLSFQAQLPGIIRYFSIGRPISGADFRLLGIRRGEAGKARLIDVSDQYVIFPKGSKGWTANPSIRGPKNGDITAGSVRKEWTRFREAYLDKPQPTPWADRQWLAYRLRKASPLAVPVLGGLSFGLVWLARKN